MWHRTTSLVACVFTALAPLAMAAGGSPLPTTETAPANQAIGIGALRVYLELGSDFDQAPPTEQQQMLRLIDNRGQRADLEASALAAIAQVEPQTPIDQLVAAEGTTVADDLLAARLSYARHLAANQANDAANAARQFRACQQYSALAANAIEQSIKGDTQTLEQWLTHPYSRRRGAQQQSAMVTNLRDSGLSPAHRTLLAAAGLSDAQTKAYIADLLKRKPQEIGSSATELLAGINNARRQTAERLQALANSDPGQLAGPGQETFLVANPADKPETITLSIRRASIPPAWKVIVLNADERGAGAGSKPKFPIAEELPGQRYTVHLPPGQRTRITSIVIPVGEVAQDTMASWAVEGAIGEKPIGGMMLQMRVPASIPPVQLPQVGRAGGTSSLAEPTVAAAAPPSTPAAPRAQRLRPYLWLFLIVLLLIVLLLVLRRVQAADRRGRSA
jgi:hypothetical protein